MTKSVSRITAKYQTYLSSLSYLRKKVLKQLCLFVLFRIIKKRSFNLLCVLDLKQLLNHLNLHSLRNPHLFAHRPTHCTETALLKVLSDLLTASDNDKVSILALLDLSAAVDDRSRLLHRLQHSFSFSESVFSWFSSYLTDRTQAA